MINGTTTTQKLAAFFETNNNRTLKIVIIFGFVRDPGQSTLYSLFIYLGRKEKNIPEKCQNTIAHKIKLRNEKVSFGEDDCVLHKLNPMKYT